MAFFQTDLEFIEMAHEVGIPDPRAEEIYLVGELTGVDSTESFAEELNAAGYYDEKADQFEAIGLTYV